MTQDQIAISAIIVAAMTGFLFSRWRHDMVALAALLGAVAVGVVDGDAAFQGFAHPAVITVAAILMLSRGLQNAGAVQMIARRALPTDAPPAFAVGALVALAAALSGFMNNVGALALMMPVALQLADRIGWPPARVLMPVSFGAILGGMTTLIGTPPNLIVSGFRAEEVGAPFDVFDFTPVGGVVALIGVTFVAVAGRWLVPARERPGAGGFDTGAYVTEARAPEGAKAVGMTLAELEKELEKTGAQTLGLVRNDVRLRLPGPQRRIRAGDVLLLEAEPGALGPSLTELGLAFEEPASGEQEPHREDADARREDGVELGEFALLPQSPLIGRSAATMRLRRRFGVGLLAVSRQGRQEVSRLRSIRLNAGDVILLQGPPEALSAAAAELQAAPLADRGVAVPNVRKVATAVGIIAAAVAAATLGLLPTAVAFTAGALAAMATNVLPPREAYDAIDWPVIVLLGALIPVAEALDKTGAAQLLANAALDVLGDDPMLAIALLMVVTIMLSDFVNNAAVAAAMCPVAVGAASRLDAAPEPFLMAVAVAASSAFLTPIGHQNNTLILGPSGLRFGDFWRLGLPLEIMVVVVATPLILWVWPP